MAEIIESVFSQREVTVDPALLDLAEQLLARVKTGEVTSFIGAAVRRGGDYIRLHAGDITTVYAAGLLVMMQARLVERNDRDNDG